MSIDGITIATNATMSLDGFVAYPDDGIGPLFDWYGNGPIHRDTANPEIGFDLTEASAGWLGGFLDRVGALVVGRHLYDITSGWGGTHPLGVPVVVVSHSVPDDIPTGATPLEFAGDVETGVRLAAALVAANPGRDVVAVAAGNTGSQAIELGLVDEVFMDLVPVVLGEGRPYFSNLSLKELRFGDPEIVAGSAVTHLRFRRAG